MKLHNLLFFLVDYCLYLIKALLEQLILGVEGVIFLLERVDLILELVLHLVEELHALVLGL